MKIRYLQRKFPSTEWSGVLFYTYEGSFEENNLVITCKDIYPMDLGNSTYTEFFMSEDVTNYIADNCQELWDCDLGLVHSHHNMSTFFSGTDTSTLRSEGDERNCFVSLIVNNAGNYSAAITRKVVSNAVITTVSTPESYEFFGEGSIKLNHDSSETQEEVVQTKIQYFMLDIEKEEAVNPFEYIDKRFDEIKERKEAARKSNYNGSGWYNKNSSPCSPWTLSQKPYRSDDDEFWGWLDKKNSEKEVKEEVKEKESKQQPMLWDDDVMKSLEVEAEEAEIIPEDIDAEYEPNKEEIRKAVVRLITCSLIHNVDKFDIKQWIRKHMEKVYDKIFESENSQAFKDWCSLFIEFILSNFRDPNIEEETYTHYADYYQSVVAIAIEQEIAHYANDNPYIEAYCNELEQYIV